jgi:hypothetical protein
MTRRDPVRLLFSPVPWAAAWYLLTYLIVGWGLFAVALIIVVGTGTVFGIPIVLVTAPALIWGCAFAERARLRVVDAEPLESAHRGATRAGIAAGVRARWTDPAIWRDVTYLFGLLAPLWVLDLAVVTIWATFLSGITVPLWYGHGAGGSIGPAAVGGYVHTLPSALVLAVICLVAFLLFTYVVVAAARLHASIARALLAAPEDPLREAKEVLRGPGPLTPFSHNERW